MPGPPGPDPPAERLAYCVAEPTRLTGLSRDLLDDQMRRGNMSSCIKSGRRRLITRQRLWLSRAPRPGEKIWLSPAIGPGSGLFVGQPGAAGAAR
jgi:hypothetical protein